MVLNSLSLSTQVSCSHSGDMDELRLSSYDCRVLGCSVEGRRACRLLVPCYRRERERKTGGFDNGSDPEYGCVIRGSLSRGRVTKGQPNKSFNRDNGIGTTS